jgi:hypothetical protein
VDDLLSGLAVDRIPPAEFENQYYAQSEGSAMVA